jgi:superfamily I DNA/RNA helicase
MSEYLERIASIEQDEDQYAALYAEGSQVVIAGPGSGKTYLLTTKAAKLLLEDTVRYPQKIACITFSRQLAEKLVKEFRELGVYDAERMYVGTIHSFCIAEIIIPATNLLPAGSVPQPFKIASQSDIQNALSLALESQKKKLPSTEKDAKNVESNLDKFRRLHYKPDNQDEFESYFPEVDGYSSSDLADLNWAKLARDYHEYLLIKNSPSSLDFVEVEMLSLKILKEYPQLATTLAAAYPWWFIDEYQDLSPLFHRIVCSLVETRKISVFAIGDPNQCIYEELQGSKPETISDLAQVTGNQVIKLQRNYRSTQEIIDFSNEILGQPNQYKSNLANVGEVIVIDINNSVDEQTRIIKHIASKTSKIAILVPTRSSVKEQLKNFDSFDIAADKDPEFTSNTELLGWLQQLAQWCAGTEKVYFYELLPFWHAFLGTNQNDDISQRFEAERSLFTALWGLRNANLALSTWLKRIQETILTRDRLSRYCSLRPDDIHEFKKLVDAVKKSDRLEKKQVRWFGKNGANIFLTTFHSSKGLQFDTTIVIDLDGWRQSVPELRNRLAYVAVSRAKEKLYVLILTNGEFASKIKKMPSSMVTYWQWEQGQWKKLE